MIALLVKLAIVLAIDAAVFNNLPIILTFLISIITDEYITKVYQDIASGISFKNRDDFFKLLDLILQGKVKQVVITHKDRLSRVGFDLFKYLFDHYNTKIVVVSDEENPKTDEQELFEEIISLLHCFSMRMYSHRRKERRSIEERLKDIKE